MARESKEKGGGRGDQALLTGKKQIVRFREIAASSTIALAATKLSAMAFLEASRPEMSARSFSCRLRKRLRRASRRFRSQAWSWAGG
jgi:hypothetical protein